MQDKPYNEKSDVWAAGCVLYELSTKHRPFTGNSVPAIAVKILRGAYQPLPDCYSSDLRSLVALLLTKKPSQRPTVAEVSRPTRASSPSKQASTWPAAPTLLLACSAGALSAILAGGHAALQAACAEHSGGTQGLLLPLS